MSDSYLRQLRKQKGQKNLTMFAASIGLNKGYLSQIETGKRPISDAVLSAYEQGLGLSKGALRQMLEEDRLEPTSVSTLLKEVWSQPLGAGTGEGIPFAHAAGGAWVPLITGVRNVQLQACALLAAAAEERRRILSGEEILIAFNNSLDALAVAQDLQGIWLSTLAQVLERGWRVVHLWVLAGDVAQTIALIRKMFPLLGQHGEYSPLYHSHEQYKTPAPFGIVLVPGHGAMLLFGVEQGIHFDTAFTFTDPDALSYLKKYFHRLSEGARSLLTVHQSRSVDFDYELANADNQHGERCMIKDGFSNMLLPRSVYTRRLDTLSTLKIANGTAIDAAARFRYRQCLDYRIQRIASFEEHVVQWPVRHIVSKQAIVRMLENGELARDDWIMSEDWARLSREEAAECVRNVIHMLNSHPKFELGLVDESEYSEHLHVFWTAIGDHSVLLEAWREGKDDERQESDLVIKEPMVVTAFQGHFEHIWQSMEPTDRSRSSVIAWLEHQLILLC